jgi:hypothetical protein
LASTRTLSIARIAGSVTGDEGRVVAFSAYRATNQTGVNPNASAVKINVDTVSKDTHGAFSTSNNRYVAPVTGFYDFNLICSITATNVLASDYIMQLSKNGSAYSYGLQYRAQVTNGFTITGSFMGVFLNAGEYVEMFFYGSGNNSASTLTALGGATVTIFSGAMRSGSASIDPPASVNMRYTNTAGTSIANSGEIAVPFATKDYDSHNAFDGATGIFTVPVSGKYQIKMTCTFAAAVYAVGNRSVGIVYKNGVYRSAGPFFTAQTTTSMELGAFVIDTVNCVAGDTLQGRLANNRTAGASTLATTGGFCHIEIERVGN